ncbi:MAG: phage portal protein [Bacteroidales bacterium]|nr:phage portal protein [Bacteroidales bacterium]
MGIFMRMLGYGNGDGLGGEAVQEARGEKKRSEAKNVGGSYRERIVGTANEEAALRIAAVNRAAAIRSESLGMMRMRMMRYNNVSDSYEECRDKEGRRMNRLLQVRPNHLQNAFDFWERVERMRIFYGHCYILCVRGVYGEVVELIPCFGDWERGGNTYTLTETNFGINGKVVEADEVIVLRNCPTRDYPNGQSIIRYAARTQGLNATIEQLSLENAAKGGRQKLILQQKEAGSLTGIGGLAPEEMEAQAQRLQEAIYSQDVVYDDSVGTITPINMNAVDLQLLDTRKFTVADIARFFGVPRAMLMDDTNSHYTTAEAANLDFMSHTLGPTLCRIEAEMNAKLLAESEFGVLRFSFDTRAMRSLDIAALGSYNKNKLETGVASVNELRKEMGMPRVEGGDDHYVTCNVAPIGSRKLNGESEGGHNDEGGND